MSLCISVCAPGSVQQEPRPGSLSRGAAAAADCAATRRGFPGRLHTLPGARWRSAEGRVQGAWPVVSADDHGDASIPLSSVSSEFFCDNLYFPEIAHVVFCNPPFPDAGPGLCRLPLCPGHQAGAGGQYIFVARVTERGRTAMLETGIRFSPICDSFFSPAALGLFSFKTTHSVQTRRSRSRGCNDVVRCHPGRPSPR